jgi:hypothetical protein
MIAPGKAHSRGKVKGSDSLAFELLPLLLLLQLLLGLLLPLALELPFLFLFLMHAFVFDDSWLFWWLAVLAMCPKRSEKKDEKTPTIVPFTYDNDDEGENKEAVRTTMTVTIRSNIEENSTYVTLTTDAGNHPLNSE